MNDLIAFLEEHPELHVQGYWRCSSGMCLAGWASEIYGAGEWRWKHDFTETDVPTYAWGQLVSKDTGETIHARELGQELLGLTDVEAAWLFSASNTLDDIKSYAAAIASGEFLPSE
jgi:hypothetical protein